MLVSSLLTARRGSITLADIASIAIIEADKLLLSCLLQYSQALNYRLYLSLPPQIRQYFERLHDTTEQEKRKQNTFADATNVHFRLAGTATKGQQT